MGLKRLSQAVTPVDAANADPNRYLYLTPENAEPSLGVPDGNGYILYSNVDGSRIFTEIGNLLIEGSGILIDANGTISIDPNILVNVNIAANVDVTRTGFTRFDYVTPAGQTLIIGADVNGQQIEFSANDQVMVYVDGFLLQSNVDYTYANGYNDGNVTSALTLAVATQDNSIVSIHRISPTLFGQGADGNIGFTGSTDDITEGVNNLFFNNTRARAAFSASDSIDYDVANGIFSANVEYANGLIEAFVGDNTTTDSITEGSNLFFTDARAILAVRDNINTSNVIEGANLYFTNDRVITALTAGQNITIEANGLIVAETAGTFSGNTNQIPEGTANLYFTDARAIAALTGANLSIFNNDGDYLTSSDLTTSNVAEGSNLYYTDERVRAFVSANISTSNITEGGNLFFTDARAIAAVKDNINTSNILEGGNLFFTNARVEAFVSSNITTSNVAEGANLYFSNDRAIASLTAGENITIYPNGLILSSATFGGALPTFYTSNIIEDGDVTTGNVYFTNARAREALQGSFGVGYDNTTGTFFFQETDITTSNIAEGANLYFSNERVVAALTAGDNIVIESNGLIVSQATLSALPTIYTANIVESGNPTTGNVYFTNARARSAFTFGPGLSYNVLTGALQANVRSVNGQTGIIVLDTDDIAEGSSNLYFTANRVYDSLTAGTGIDAAQLANGTIELESTILESIGSASDLVTGNIIPSQDGIFTLGNATHRWRDLFVGAESINIGDVQLTAPLGRLKISNRNSGGLAFSTSEIEEGANLWFTNARVYASLTAKSGIDAAELANGNIRITFGNSNVQSYIEDSITTDDITEGASNFYFSNTRTRRAFTAGAGINAANLAVGILSVDTGAGGALSGFINASNVIETGTPTTGNVFFSNTRAIRAFTAGPGINPANLALGSISANVVSVAGKTGVVLLYTGNIIESGDTTNGNVFFSNTRARRAFTAGAGVNASDLASGIITVTGGGGGGSSNFTEANILAGTGITVTRADGNATITNAGVLRVRPADDAGNSILTTTVDGNVSLSLRPNVSVIGWLNAGNILAGNIIADTLTVNGQSLLVGGGSNELTSTIRASNVIESGDTTTGNVFFSNTRAIRAFTAGDNIDAADLANGIISTTVDDFAGTSDVVPEGTNNLYYSNTRVLAYLRDSGDLTLDDISPGSGDTTQFFSNDLARQAFTAGSGIDEDDLANGILTVTVTDFSGTTDNVPEGSSNLYFTTQRVIDAVTGLDVALFTNDAEYVSAKDALPTAFTANVKKEISATNNGVGYGNLAYDNTTGVVTYNRVTNSNIYSAFTAGPGINASNLALGILSSDSLVIGTTDDVPEGSNNLYYSNSAVLALLSNIYGTTVYDTVGGIGDSTFTNITVLGEIITNGEGGDISNTNCVITSSIAANNWYGLFTSNVEEVPGYTFYTDERVYANVRLIPLSALTNDQNFVSATDVRTLINANTGLGYNSTTGNVYVKLGGNIFVDGSGNLDSNKFTGSEAQVAVKTFLTATNSGVGHGSLSYSSLTGQFTYNKVTNTNIRSAIDANVYAAEGHGSLSYNEADGNIMLTKVSNANIRSAVNATDGLYYTQASGTFGINVGESLSVNSEGYLNVEATDAIRSSIDATSTGEGHGNVSYDSETGLVTYVRTSNANVRSALSAGDGLTYTESTGEFEVKFGSNIYANVTGHVNLDTSNLFESAQTSVKAFMKGANTGTGFGDLLYDDQTGTYTFDRVTSQDIRTQLAANIASTGDGHGSLSYDSTTGNVILTKVSNANVRSALSSGDGITYTESTGVIAVNIGDYLNFDENGRLNGLPPFTAEDAGAAALGQFSATNTGTGYGDLSYDVNTGIYTFDRVTDAEIRTAVSNSIGISYVASTGVIKASFGGNVTSNVNGYIDVPWSFNKEAQTAVRTYLTAAAVNPGTLDGHGNLVYNSGSGRYTYTRVSNANVRSALSIAYDGVPATSAEQHSKLEWDESTGTFTYRPATRAQVRVSLNAANNFAGYGNLKYSNTTGYYTLDRVTPADVRSAFRSDTEGTGFGDFTYNQTDGVFTYTKVSEADVRGSISVAFSEGALGVLGYNSETGVFGLQTPTLGNYLAIDENNVLYATWPNADDIKNALIFSDPLEYDSVTGQGLLKFGGNITMNAEGYIDVLEAGGKDFNDGEIFLDTGDILNVDPQASIRMKSLGVGAEATGTAGEIIATNDITAFYSSDERLKTNVNVIDNALVKIDKIRGVSFDWNDTAQEMYPDRAIRDVGVIAQEIEQVLPEVVANRDNGYKAVRYEKLVALLIQAVKELKQEVDELKKNR